MLPSLLHELSFTPTIHIPNDGNLRVFFTEENRCGIYVLHFADGDVYIGQSIDIAGRFHQHRLNSALFGSPIVAFNYKLVDRLQLDNVEKETIRKFLELRKTLPKGESFKLKNIKDNEYQRGHAPFDAVMPPELQERWLADLRYIDKHGVRYESPELRSQYAAKFNNKFRRMPYARLVAQTMRDYVRAAIPAILQGEALYWNCSCVPQVAVYSRISVGWQEVFTAYFEKTDYIPVFAISLAYEHMPLAALLKPLIRFFDSLTPSVIFEIHSELYDFEVPVIEQTFRLKRKGFPSIRQISFNCSNLTMVMEKYVQGTSDTLATFGLSRQVLATTQEALTAYFDKIESLVISSHRYDAGGPDQIRLEVRGTHDAYLVINNPEYRRGMRELNLRLARKGTSSWKNSHCLSLADYLVGPVQTNPPPIRSADTH